jgi:hypothetical protein
MSASLWRLHHPLSSLDLTVEIRIQKLCDAAELFLRQVYMIVNQTPSKLRIGHGSVATIVDRIENEPSDGRSTHSVLELFRSDAAHIMMKYHSFLHKLLLDSIFLGNYLCHSGVHLCNGVLILVQNVVQKARVFATCCKP